MKIQIFSDLHREFSKYEITPTDSDVIVLAGDIGVGADGVEWAKTLGKPVIYVAGNHEYYHGDIDATLTQMRDSAKGSNVHFLENDSVTINGITFLGCTLWTDYEVFGANMQSSCMRLAERSMNDHRRISKDGDRFLPLHALELHKVSRIWLEENLAAINGKAVVVSHHLPLLKCTDPRYMHDLLTGSFASDLPSLMDKADLWIYGHTHDSHDFTAGKTRVVSNPRGYSRSPTGRENAQFKDDLVINV